MTTNREITKEILISMIQNGLIRKSLKNGETSSDFNAGALDEVGKAFNEIYNTVKNVD